MLIDAVRRALHVLGSSHPATKAILRVYGAYSGVCVQVGLDAIDISKGDRTIRIAKRDFSFTRDMCGAFDTFFSMIETPDGVADYSRPALHRFRESGVSFWFPSIPEEKSAIQSYGRFDPPK